MCIGQRLLLLLLCGLRLHVLVEHGRECVEKKVHDFSRVLQRTHIAVEYVSNEHDITQYEKNMYPQKYQ